MNAEGIPAIEPVAEFVGRRDWLKRLIVLEVILVVGAFTLNSIGGTLTRAATDPTQTGNAQTVTIFAAMLGAYALLLAIIGSVVLLVSVLLAARRAGRTV